MVSSASFPVVVSSTVVVSSSFMSSTVLEKAVTKSDEKGCLLYHIWNPGRERRSSGKGSEGCRASAG